MIQPAPAIPVIGRSGLGQLTMLLDAEPTALYKNVVLVYIASRMRAMLFAHDLAAR